MFTFFICQQNFGLGWQKLKLSGCHFSAVLAPFFCTPMLVYLPHYLSIIECRLLIYLPLVPSVHLLLTHCNFNITLVKNIRSKTDFFFFMWDEGCKKNYDVIQNSFIPKTQNFALRATIHLFGLGRLKM